MSVSHLNHLNKRIQDVFNGYKVVSLKGCGWYYFVAATGDGFGIVAANGGDGDSIAVGSGGIVYAYPAT